MKVEIFSDIACPYCYIGKRNFQRALEGFEAEPVEVIWKSFQLNPGLSDDLEGDMHDYLAAKYGVSRDEAIAMNDRMLAMAMSAGIEMNLDGARPRNTFDAHRMLQLAVETGCGNELAEELFSAYFTGSADVADPDDLAELADRAGIDRDLAVEVAHGDRYRASVENDCADAAEIGVTAVPAFIFDRRFYVPGAQPPEVLRSALDQAAGLPA